MLSNAHSTAACLRNVTLAPIMNWRVNSERAGPAPQFHQGWLGPFGAPGGGRADLEIPYSSSLLLVPPGAYWSPENPPSTFCLSSWALLRLPILLKATPRTATGLLCHTLQDKAKP